MRTELEVPEQTGPAPIPTASARQLDGWRVVTGIIAALLFWGGIYLFAAAATEHRQAQECAATGDWFCWDFSEALRLMGFWAIAVAACFALATIAPAGLWRRGLVIAGIVVLFSPIFITLARGSPVALVLLLSLTAFFLAWAHLGRRRSRHGSGAQNRGDQ